MHRRANFFSIHIKHLPNCAFVFRASLFESFCFKIRTDFWQMGQQEVPDSLVSFLSGTFFGVGGSDFRAK